MRVVVYEPTPTGHHFAYLTYLLPALAELPCEPILLTPPAARRSPEFEHHLGSLGTAVAVDTSLEELGDRRGMSAWRHELNDLVAAVRRLEPDHLYVPYGEGVARAAGLAGLSGRRGWDASVASEVLLVRGAFAYPTTNGLSRLGKRVAPWLIRRGPWDRIHHINPDDHAVLAGRDERFSMRCRLMPDPVEPPVRASRAEARQALGLSEDGRYVGCVGGIGWRKGGALLSSAFRAAASRLRPDDRLLLAGPFEPDIRAQIEREAAAELANGRVVLIDRLLTTAELNLAVAALDLVCTPYRNHPHSASVVIRAAVAGRPVLGSATGWMGRTIDRFGLGTTCAVTDRSALAKAIAEALGASDEYIPIEAARRFAEFHSVRNFVLHWTALLRERLAVPDGDGRVDWEWVTAALPAARRAYSIRNRGSAAMRRSISSSSRR
jgi:glycosyltransferase involved in cell wall biosynthesis